MTDQQIINDIATKVMGANAKPADAKYAIDFGGKDVCWSKFSDSAYPFFDPLRDANHTKLARDKMREMGYHFDKHDHTVGLSGKFDHFWVIVNKGVYVVSECTHKTDELRAECLAILEAVKNG